MIAHAPEVPGPVHFCHILAVAQKMNKLTNVCYKRLCGTVALRTASACGPDFTCRSVTVGPKGRYIAFRANRHRSSRFVTDYVHNLSQSVGYSGVTRLLEIAHSRAIGTCGCHILQITQPCLKTYNLQIFENIDAQARLLQLLGSRQNLVEPDGVSRRTAALLLLRDAAERGRRRVERRRINLC